MFLINTCMAIFKGFSTIDKVRAPYTLTDIDLVKRDLLNHFYTKKGERLMKPNFGSIIWDLLMEPEDTVTEEDIKNTNSIKVLPKTLLNLSLQSDRTFVY